MSQQHERVAASSIEARQRPRFRSASEATTPVNGDDGPGNNTAFIDEAIEQLVRCEFMTYVILYYKSTAEALMKTVLAFYTSHAICQAKTLMWKMFANELPPERRRVTSALALPCPAPRATPRASEGDVCPGTALPRSPLPELPPERHGESWCVS